MVQQVMVEAGEHKLGELQNQGYTTFEHVLGVWEERYDILWA